MTQTDDSRVEETILKDKILQFDLFSTFYNSFREYIRSNSKILNYMFII